MQGYFLFSLENAFALMCAIFAFSQGDRGERLGAIWLALDLAGGTIINFLRIDSPALHLLEDGIFAVGLLPLAVIYVSYWIGAVTLLAAGLFALEALYLINDWPADGGYMLTNNLLWIAVPLTFLVSGFCHYVRRKRRVDSTVAASG